MVLRKKVPTKTASEVMDAVDLRCCMCPTELGGLPRMIRNGQIHHLDGNRSNGAVGNLVYLCLDCHEEAGKLGRAARRWTPDLIARRRDRLASRIQAERRPSYHGSPGFRDALDALVVMDVRLLSSGRDEEWADAQRSLSLVQSYPSEIGVNARRAILAFLYDLTGNARFGMPSDVAHALSSCTINLLPLGMLQSGDNDLAEEDLDLLETAASIGGDLAYDGALYCQKLEIVESGGEVLWRVLSYAKTRSLSKLEETARIYFEQAFDGARRSSTPYAVELLELAMKHGEAGNWRRIVLPDKVLRAMADET